MSKKITSNSLVKPKLLLVYPNYSKILGRVKYRRFEIYAGAGKIPERPHVGLGYLSEMLLKYGFDHEVIDMNLLNSYQEFKTQAKKYHPEVIGLTMVTPGYLKGYQLIKRIKKDFPKAKIITGGPHISLMQKQLLKECPQIDVGFISEAEQSLVEYLKNNCQPDQIAGVVFKKGRKIFFNPPKLAENIDIFPFPKYQKFDLTKYSEISIYTSRGCPFRCIFCTVESYRRKAFRPRSAKSVIEEIIYWYQKGQRVFPIEDDNFTLDMDRVSRLCDEIKKINLPGLKFALGQGVRADRVNRKLLQKMFLVGFKYITIAVEAGNNRILQNLNKLEKIEQIEKTIKDACEVGFEVRLLFVVGAPGESWADIEDSLHIAQKYPVMTTRFNNLLPIPGTKLFEWVKKNKLFTYLPEVYLNSDNLDYTQAFYETPELTLEQRKQAIISSDRINQKLFYRYLLAKLKIFGPLKYPLSFLASRQRTQYLIADFPILYRLALTVRKNLL